MSTGGALQRGDATRLGVVLSNVLSNLLKYTPPGGNIHVVARPGERAAPSSSLHIRIVDGGRDASVPPPILCKPYDVTALRKMIRKRLASGLQPAPLTSPRL
jgi:signal transduction histidine kinase